MLPTITNRPCTNRPISSGGRLVRLGPAIALLWLASAGAHAQYPYPYSPPAPPLTSAPCVPTRKAPCPDQTPANAAPPAEKFPFPGEDEASTSAKPDAQTQAPAPIRAAPSPAGDFPFPGEPEIPAASAGKPAPPPAEKFPFPGEPESPAASSSSSSSSSSSAGGDLPDPDADKPALKDMGSSGSKIGGRRHLPKVEDLDHRFEEDLQVSHYYVTTGNFLGAYLRAQDAVKTFPDDPAGHLALAETAERLKKNEEAIAEYKTYLKLDPEGDDVKAAQRSLSQLSPK